MACIITTSRYPTRRIRSFTKDLHSAIPTSIRVTRGKKGIRDLEELCSIYGANRVLIIGRYKGCPGKMNFLKMTPRGLTYIPFTLLIGGVTLLREINPLRRGSLGREDVDEIFIAYVGKGDIEKAAYLLGEGFDLKVKQLEGISEVKEFETTVSVLMVTKDRKRGQLAIKFYENRGLREIGPRIRVKKVIEWKEKSTNTLQE